MLRTVLMAPIPGRQAFDAVPVEVLSLDGRPRPTNPDDQRQASAGAGPAVCLAAMIQPPCLQGKIGVPALACMLHAAAPLPRPCRACC